MNGEISVEREIFIAASPETVFRFFVEPAFMARWFGKQHTLDPRPRGIFRVEVGAGNFAHGAYTEITPHRRIVFTWGWEGRGDLPPGGSLVEIELVSKNGGTLLRLRHSGLPQTAEAPFRPKDHRKNWANYLARLRQQCAIPMEHERRTSGRSHRSATLRPSGRPSSSAPRRSRFTRCSWIRRSTNHCRGRKRISAERSGAPSRRGESIFPGSTWCFSPVGELSRLGAPMIGGPITIQSSRLTYAHWMVARSFASRRSACRPTAATVILADGSKRTGNQCRNSVTRGLLVTKRVLEVRRLGNELIKEISEEASSYRRGASVRICAGFWTPAITRV